MSPGFKKRGRDESSPGFYYHPSFQRDHPELLDQVRRTYPSGVKPADEYSSAEEDTHGSRRSSPPSSSKFKAPRPSPGARQQKGVISRPSRTPYLTICRNTAWGVERRPLPINKAVYDDLVRNKPTRPWFYSGSPALTEAAIRKERAVTVEARRKAEMNQESDCKTYDEGRKTDDGVGDDGVRRQDGNISGLSHGMGTKPSILRYRGREDSPERAQTSINSEVDHSNYAPFDCSSQLWNTKPIAANALGRQRADQEYHVMESTSDALPTSQHVSRREPSSSIFPAGTLQETRQYLLESQERHHQRPVYLPAHAVDGVHTDADGGGVASKPVWNGAGRAWPCPESGLGGPPESRECMEWSPTVTGGETKGGRAMKRTAADLAADNWEATLAAPVQMPPGHNEDKMQALTCPQQDPCENRGSPPCKGLCHDLPNESVEVQDRNRQKGNGFTMLAASAGKAKVEGAIAHSRARAMEAM